jgi:hypothetical protein
MSHPCQICGIAMGGTRAQLCSEQCRIEWRARQRNRRARNQRRYYEANREKLKVRYCEQRRRYYAANRDAERQKRRQRYYANHEKNLARYKRYYAANRDAERERNHRYYAANRERNFEHQRRYRKQSSAALQVLSELGIDARFKIARSVLKELNLMEELQ